MRPGIAQLCVEARIDVVGCEVTLELVERARNRIAGFLAQKVEKGQLAASDDEAAVARRTLTDDLADLAGCDFVIEAIVEELAPK
jgi:3-hydroxyacyl-CoA dehydrogenase